jgi:hypothetical protein
VSGLVDTVEDPAFATAVGLMTLDMLLFPMNGDHQVAGSTNAAVFGFIDGIMNKFKKR